MLNSPDKALGLNTTRTYAYLPYVLLARGLSPYTDHGSLPQRVIFGASTSTQQLLSQVQTLRIMAWFRQTRGGGGKPRYLFSKPGILQEPTFKSDCSLPQFV